MDWASGIILFIQLVNALAEYRFLVLIKSTSRPKQMHQEYRKLVIHILTDIWVYVSSVLFSYRDGSIVDLDSVLIGTSTLAALDSIRLGVLLQLFALKSFLYTAFKIAQTISSMESAEIQNLMVSFMPRLGILGLLLVYVALAEFEERKTFIDDCRQSRVLLPKFCTHIMAIKQSLKIYEEPSMRENADDLSFHDHGN